MTLLENSHISTHPCLLCCRNLIWSVIYRHVKQEWFYTVLSNSYMFVDRNHVRLFATPWTVARQAPLSTGFPRREYCSGLPFPSPKTSAAYIWSQQYVILCTGTRTLASGSRVPSPRRASVPGGCTCLSSSVCAGWSLAFVSQKAASFLLCSFKYVFPRRSKFLL